jgi:hypothetical protein
LIYSLSSVCWSKIDVCDKSKYTSILGPAKTTVEKEAMIAIKINENFFISPPKLIN